MKLKISYYLSETTGWLILTIVLSVVVIHYLLVKLSQSFSQIPILKLLGTLLEKMIAAGKYIIACEVIALGVIIALLILLNRDKSFADLWQTDRQTYIFRKYSLYTPNEDSNQIEQLTAAERSYNFAIKSSYIEKQKDKVIAWIKLPETSQGMEIFECQLDKIIQKIKENNPNFYFSLESEQFSYYCLVGIRKS